MGGRGEQVQKSGEGSPYLLQHPALQVVHVDKGDGVAALEEFQPRKGQDLQDKGQVRRNFSAPSWREENSSEPSRDYILLYKRREPARFFLPFSPLLFLLSSFPLRFPHFPLLAFHPLEHILKLSFTACGTLGPTCLFKRPPLPLCIPLPPLSSVSLVQQTIAKGFCKKKKNLLGKEVGLVWILTSR